MLSLIVHQHVLLAACGRYRRKLAATIAKAVEWQQIQTAISIDEKNVRYHLFMQ